jgi:Protein of unknown function (DUF2829)
LSRLAIRLLPPLPRELARRDFGDALAAMHAGQEVRRRSWEPGLTVALVGQRFDTISRSAGWAHRSPWIPTHASILAEDWEVAVLPPPRAGRRRAGNIG